MIYHLWLENYSTRHSIFPISSQKGHQRLAIWRLPLCNFMGLSRFPLLIGYRQRSRIIISTINQDVWSLWVKMRRTLVYLGRWHRYTRWLGTLAPTLMRTKNCLMNSPCRGIPSARFISPSFQLFFPFTSTPTFSAFGVLLSFLLHILCRNLIFCVPITSCLLQWRHEYLACLAYPAYLALNDGRRILTISCILHLPLSPRMMLNSQGRAKG